MSNHGKGNPADPYRPALELDTPTTTNRSSLWIIVLVLVSLTNIAYLVNRYGVRPVFLNDELAFWLPHIVVAFCYAMRSNTAIASVSFLAITTGIVYSLRYSIASWSRRPIVLQDVPSYFDSIGDFLFAILPLVYFGNLCMWIVLAFDWKRSKVSDTEMAE